MFRQPEKLVNLAPEEVKKKINMGNGLKIIDVRTAGEFERQHLDGAILIPLRTVKHAAPALDKEGEYLLICKSGHRSRAAAAELFRQGFSNVSHLEGGMMAWNREFRK